MDFYVGNTDWEWYAYLRALIPAPEDINFWKPSAASFSAIPLGAPFLLKLKKPYYKIAGVGFFMGYSKLPLSMAWEAFANRNGCPNFEMLSQQIVGYRSKMGIGSDRDPEIGCIALTDPIFFEERDWIDAPADWASPIVSGKTYSTDTTIGRMIWETVEDKLHLYRIRQKPIGSDLFAKEHYQAAEDTPAFWHGYGPATTHNPRIGQGAFRILVTNAYQRRCAITGESVISVLEAAHIQDFSQQGPHAIQNGLLLRADLHKLLDAGLMTVTPDYRIEIAKATQEQHATTSGYLGLHGQKLLHMPRHPQHHPDQQYLSWHNENQFKG